MHDQPKLTARQQEILELIQKTIAETGAPPTRAEIAQVLGFKSANAAEEHLQALARKGAIDLVSGTSRGIRLKGRPATASANPPTFSACHCLVLPNWHCHSLAAWLLGPLFWPKNTSIAPTMSKATCSKNSPTTCFVCAACPCETQALWMATCWPSKPPKKFAMAKLWWPASATKSPSSACAVKQTALNFFPKTPTTPLSWSTQASPSTSKAWRSASFATRS